jgi:hypothetical protein
MRAGRRRRRRDARVPDRDGAAPRETDLPARPGSAAAQLVGLHGDVDAAHATV